MEKSNDCILLTSEETSLVLQAWGNVSTPDDQIGLEELIQEVSTSYTEARRADQEVVSISINPLGREFLLRRILNVDPDEFIFETPSPTDADVAAMRELHRYAQSAEGKMARMILKKSEEDNRHRPISD